MIRCPACSGETPDGSRFCPSCGGLLETTTSAPTETGLGARPAATAGRDDSPDQARFIPGVVLAQRYRIVGLLGRGGMGEVYRADDLKLGQSVALKFLPPEAERDRGRLDRFLNEVKVALKVTHPNVCRVYDIGETQGWHYISMEYVDGETWLRCCGGSAGFRGTRPSRLRGSSARASRRPTNRGSCTGTSSPPT